MVPLRQDSLFVSRHHCLYGIDRIYFTHLPGLDGAILASNCANSHRSSARNRLRPAATTTNGSSRTRSVQLAGRAIRWPSSKWKNTRSSPQLLRYTSNSNSRPNKGWKGCVTRKRRRAMSASGVVDDGCQSVCGTPNRVHSAGMSESFRDSQRRAPAEDVGKVFRLLSPVASAPSARQAMPCPSSSDQRRPDHSDPTTRRSSRPL